MIENLKLGPLDGFNALIVIVFLAIALVVLIAVLFTCILKAIKEKNDEKEDKAENEFYSEYGVTGEELRLNQKLARLRNQVKEAMRGNKCKNVVESDVNEQPVEEPVVEQEPIVEETLVEQVAADKTVEPEKAEEPVVAPAPVEEVKEEPVQEPVPEPTPEPQPVVEPEPVVEPVKEEPVKEEPVKEEPIPEPVPEKVEEPVKTGVDKPATKKVVKKKPDDWSKYDGTYEGYYYDPEDACYYEGTPSPALAKKLAAKEAELEALNANKDKKVVIKKVAPPFAALKTPKNVRKAPEKVAGFDESVIYGKYVIEHVDKEDGTQEYFYTLYDANGNNIYESSNYATKEFCERAINRFKSHAIIGTYTIEAADGKFFFVLKRKTYVHKGSPQNTFEEANARMREIKNFAQTDIVREQ